MMVLILLPSTISFTEIDWSVDNTTWNFLKKTNDYNLTIEELQNGIDCETQYFFRIRHVYNNGNSNYTYTSATTDECPEGEPMAALAIMVFVLISAGAFLFLPFIKPKLTDNEISNIILKRSCWVIGIYLMMMNATIAATIAGDAGITVTGELFRYMWIFGTLGYLIMGFMVLKTLIDVTKLWKIKKEENW